jgi:hypothetical protein
MTMHVFLGDAGNSMGEHVSDRALSFFGAIASPSQGRHGRSANDERCSPAVDRRCCRGNESHRSCFLSCVHPALVDRFPHIGIFCRRAPLTLPDDVLSVGCCSSGCHRFPCRREPRDRSCNQPKLSAGAALAAPDSLLSSADRDTLRAQASGDDVILRLVEGYAPMWLAALLGAAVMAAVMASDSQILALSTMFTQDVFAFYGGTRRFGDAMQVRTPDLRRAADDRRLRHRHAIPSRFSTSRRNMLSPAIPRSLRCWLRRSSGDRARNGAPWRSRSGQPPPC